MKTPNDNSYELRVKSETSQLEAIRNFITNNANKNLLPEQIANAIILAVDEAATNIVKHAYHYDKEKDILINFSISNDECCVSLTDYGDSFDPSLITPPDMKEYLQQRRVGGLGLFLIRTLMDSMEYKSIPGKMNLLTMKKKINK